jgi:hypothetical protein
MKRETPSQAKRELKITAESDKADPKSVEPEAVLRALARHHCAAAIAALAEVVSEAGAPAGARITAATTLLGWAFGREGGGETIAKGRGPRRPSSTEQVIRLAWLETKAAKRSKTQKRGKTKQTKEASETKA